MRGLNAPTKFYRRPEVQLSLVVLVAILFILFTYFRWIPAIATPILGISLPSQIIALGFAAMFALLSIALRETLEKRTARIDANCQFVERNLVRKITLSEAQRDIESKFTQGLLKPPPSGGLYWTTFLSWYESYDLERLELWYYATEKPQHAAFPCECGYAIVNGDRVIDRWLIWSIDITYVE